MLAWLLCEAESLPPRPWRQKTHPCPAESLPPQAGRTWCRVLCPGPRQFPLFDPTKPPPSLLTSLAPPFHHCGKPFDLGLLSEIFRLSMIVYLYRIICTRKEDLVYIHWIGSIAWCWVQSLQMMIYILNSSHITYSLLSAKIACKAKGGLCRYLWPFLMDGMMSHPSYPIGTGRPQHLSESKSYRKRPP